MAFAPIVLPNDQVILATGVVLNPVTVTAQNLLQVPAGGKLIVQGLVFRDPNGTVLATSTFQLGFGAATTTVSGSVVTSAQTAVAMTAGNTVVTYSTGVATAAVTGAAALTITPSGGAAEGLPYQYLNITFAGTPGTATQLKCDVLGYLAF